ncbi:MAG: EAL domain-containing protein [Gammaproteobacteria bacterium]|nr:EAL domain-containing protein [Gammaproteobacteria bacterium]
MVTAENTPRLLVIDPVGILSKKLIQQLQNSNFNTKALLISSDEELQHALQKAGWSLILLSPDTEQGMIRDILKYKANKDPDLSILLFSDTYQYSLLEPLLQQGIHSFIDIGRTALVPHQIQQAVTDTRKARDYRSQQLEFNQLEKRFINLMEGSRDAIAYVHDATIILANSSFAKHVGFKLREDLQGTPLLDLISEQDQGSIKELLTHFNNGTPLTESIATNIRGARNIPIPVLMEMVPTQHNGEPSILIFIREQSTNKELENKLRTLKNQDILTGLFNRQYFLDKLQVLLDKNKTEHGEHALLYIDMDNFNELKNRIGVAGSDLLLVEIAEQLRSLLKITNFTSRYDGNVFTALVQNCDEAKATQTANRVLRSIENHIAEVEGRTVTATCSIGISLINDSAPNLKEVLNRAYKACVMASNAGGNQLKFYIPMDDELADQERLSNWGKRIKQAIEQEQLHLVYQPIVSLHGHAGEKYEALLRMQSDSGDELSPGQFIPAAEKSGLMPELDRWVIQHALADLNTHRSSGKETAMFIKISPSSIEDESLIPWLQKQLSDSGIPGKHIIFEISEEVTLTHMKAIKLFILGLKQLGCQLALDHFGRTANSAVIQKHLMASFLKIDGALIHAMTGDNEAQDKVKSVIAIAAATGSQTVAQFVEDANSLALLWQTGVNYIQGYFVQQPDSLMRYDFSDMQ